MNGWLPHTLAVEFSPGSVVCAYGENAGDPLPSQANHESEEKCVVVPRLTELVERTREIRDEP